MKNCPKCGSELTVTYTRHLDSAEYKCSRVRKCTTCDYVLKTIEVPADKYEKDDILITTIIEKINELY